VIVKLFESSLLQFRGTGCVQDKYAMQFQLLSSSLLCMIVVHLAQADVSGVPVCRQIAISGLSAPDKSAAAQTELHDPGRCGRGRRNAGARARTLNLSCRWLAVGIYCPGSRCRGQMPSPGAAVAARVGLEWAARWCNVSWV
jgi:hypothetical protein